PVDEPHHLVDSHTVVAGCADRDAVPLSVGPSVFFELVVAELVEPLDHSRRGEPLLDDRAGAVRCSRELRIVTVDGLPIVSRVDEDLAREQITWELAHAIL